MKSFLKIVFAVVVSGLTACAGSGDSGTNEVPGHVQAMAMDNDFPNVDGTLFGKWHAGEYSNPEDGAKFVATFYFNKSKVGMSASCTNPAGKTVFTSLTVPAVYTKDSFEILEEKEVNTRNGDRDCLVNTVKVKMLFKLVKNDQLELKGDKNMKAFKLKRIR
ncbi:hypothetical protein [Bdellovibrio sp. HCB209]|uniref:hypothetical protein n=1 Tax=Bdellovibrio sp. HCB209 TaxID=3394354 RepID=UPI0039B4FAC9